MNMGPWDFPIHGGPFLLVCGCLVYFALKGGLIDQVVFGCSTHALAWFNSSCVYRHVNQGLVLIGLVLLMTFLEMSKKIKSKALLWKKFRIGFHFLFIDFFSNAKVSAFVDFGLDGNAR